jgi:hypothetical protein
MLLSFMAANYRLFRRVILFDFPHDFLSLGNGVRDDNLSRRACSAQLWTGYLIRFRRVLP